MFPFVRAGKLQIKIIRFSFLTTSTHPRFVNALNSISARFIIQRRNLIFQPKIFLSFAADAV